MEKRIRMPTIPKLTFTRIGLILFAICFLLINAYLNYRIASGPIVKFSLVILFFLSRHLLCFVAAYLIARYGHFDRIVLVLLFIVPSLLLFHGFFVWKANGMLELWPPILALDTALFLPSLTMYRLGKCHERSEVSVSISP